MPFGAIIGAIGAIGGAVGGGLISANGAQSAANTQVNAANAAAQVQQNEFGVTQQNLQPWIGAGGNALNVLQELLGIPGAAASTTGTSASAGTAASGYSVQPAYGETYQQGARGSDNQVQGITGYNVIGPNGQIVGTAPTQQAATSLMQGMGGTTTAPASAAPASTAPAANALTNPQTLMGTSFQSSPGYQFALGQGTQAITNSAAARGGIQGGNTLQALQQYGTGLANQDYYNWLGTFLNQANNYVGQVAGVSGLGENAAANLGNTGTTAANNIGNYLTQAGNASAAGTMGVSNAITNSLGNFNLSSLISSLSGSGLNTAVGGTDSMF